MAKKKAKGGKKGGKKAAPPAAKMPMSWDNIFGEKGLSGLLAGLQKIKSADDIYINSRDNDLANENVKLKLMERFQRDDPLFIDFLLKKTQTRTGRRYKDPRDIAVELNTGADNFLDPEGPDGFPGGLKGEAYEQAMAYVELFNFMEEAHFVHLNPSFEKYGDDAQQQYMNALRKENHTEKRKMRDVKFERKQKESVGIKDRIKKGMMGDPEGESQAEKDGLIAWFQRGLDGGAIKADEEQSYRVWAKNTVAGSKNNLERFFAEKFLTMLNQKGQRAADKKKKLAEEAEAKKAAKKAAEEPPPDEAAEPPAGPAEDPPAGGPPDDDDDDDEPPGGGGPPPPPGEPQDEAAEEEMPDAEFPGSEGMFIDQQETEQREEAAAARAFIDETAQSLASMGVGLPQAYFNIASQTNPNALTGRFLQRALADRFNDVRSPYIAGYIENSIRQLNQEANSAMAGQTRMRQERRKQRLDPNSIQAQRMDRKIQRGQRHSFFQGENIGPYTKQYKAQIQKEQYKNRRLARRAGEARLRRQARGQAEKVERGLKREDARLSREALRKREVRKDLQRTLFAEREQKEKALPARGENIRRNRAMRDKRVNELKTQLLDEIKTTTKDADYAGGYKLKQLYRQLGSTIRGGGDNKEKIRNYTQTIQNILGLDPEALPRGDAPPQLQSRITKQPAQKAQKARAFQSQLSEVPASKTSFGVAPLKNLFAKLAAQQGQLQDAGKNLGFPNVERTADYGPAKTTGKGKKAKTKKLPAKYLFENPDTGQRIDMDELARQYSNAASGFDNEALNKSLGNFLQVQSYLEFRGFKPGAQPLQQSLLAAQPGVEQQQAQPARPESFATTQEKVSRAAYDDRVGNFIRQQAINQLDRQQPLLNDAANLSQRIKQQTTPGQPFTTGRTMASQAMDIAQRTQDLRTFENTPTGGQIPGLPPQLQPAAYAGGIANPQSFAAAKRATREMEQVEPQFKKIMGELTAPTAGGAAAGGASGAGAGPKPADGTTERANKLKSMYQQKQAGYIQQWADDSSIMKTLAFDTPDQNASYATTLTALQAEEVAVADVLKEIGTDTAERPAPEPGAEAKVDAERGDSSKRDVDMERVARNITFIKNQFLKSAQEIQGVQATIASYGNQQGQPVAQIANAMLGSVKNPGRLENHLNGSGLMGNGLIPPSASGKVYAPQKYNKINKYSVGNADWGTFDYFGVGGTAGLGWGQYFNDLTIDVINGKQPVQIITDSDTNYSYLAPSTMDFANFQGQAVPVGGFGYSNGVGTIASVQKFFVGSRPVYWSHTRPNTGINSGRIQDNGADAGKFGSGSFYQSGGIRINSMINPVIDPAGVMGEPLKEESLKVGDTVRYYVNQSKKSTTDFGLQGEVRGISLSGGPLSQVDVKSTIGTITPIKKARKGSTITVKKTAAEIKRDARKAQRKASTGFRIGGRSQTLIQGS